MSRPLPVPPLDELQKKKVAELIEEIGKTNPSYLKAPQGEVTPKWESLKKEMDDIRGVREVIGRGGVTGGQLLDAVNSQEMINDMGGDLANKGGRRHNSRANEQRLVGQMKVESYLQSEGGDRAVAAAVIAAIESKFEIDVKKEVKEQVTAEDIRKSDLDADKKGWKEKGKDMKEKYGEVNKEAQKKIKADAKAAKKSAKGGDAADFEMDDAASVGIDDDAASVDSREEEKAPGFFARLKSAFVDMFNKVFGSPAKEVKGVVLPEAKLVEKGEVIEGENPMRSKSAEVNLIRKPAPPSRPDDRIVAAAVDQKVLRDVASVIKAHGGKISAHEAVVGDAAAEKDSKGASR